MKRSNAISAVLTSLFLFSCANPIEPSSNVQFLPKCETYYYPNDFIEELKESIHGKIEQTIFKDNLYKTYGGIILSEDKNDYAIYHAYYSDYSEYINCDQCHYIADYYQNNVLIASYFLTYKNSLVIDKQVITDGVEEYIDSNATTRLYDILVNRYFYDESNDYYYDFQSNSEHCTFNGRSCIKYCFNRNTDSYEYVVYEDELYRIALQCDCSSPNSFYRYQFIDFSDTTNPHYLAID